MNKDYIPSVAARLAKGMSASPAPLYGARQRLPDMQGLIRLLDDLRALFFPAFWGDRALLTQTPEAYAQTMLGRIEHRLDRQLAAVLPGGRDSEGVIRAFTRALPQVQSLLLSDVEALYDGDPAARSRQEIILAYPGLYAVFVYRAAHELYRLDVPLLPRMMTEHAHSRTGIDIHPGAEIGPRFFIDHGTGVVIGETAVIGAGVKLYQGVTLGALSPRSGRKGASRKRHPTVGNGVTVYSGATILGGDTVIGDGAVVGGNAFVTASVPPGARFSARTPDAGQE